MPPQSIETSNDLPDSELELFSFRGGLAALVCCLAQFGAIASEVIPAPQQFLQQVAHRFSSKEGLPQGAVQLIECASNGKTRACIEGQWYETPPASWRFESASSSSNPGEFTFWDAAGQPVKLEIPWREVRQIVRHELTAYVAAATRIYKIEANKLAPVNWPPERKITQMAFDHSGVLYVACSGGLFYRQHDEWRRMEISDDGGRDWAVRDVLGVGFDTAGRLWFAGKAGVGCRLESGWRFYEGKDGLPWNDFTWIASGPGSEMWFATHLGVIRFDGADWHYLQGPRWLPSDDVSQLAVDGAGTAWFATTSGVGCLERRAMTLEEKAEFYENEIARYVKRTPFGYVAEARLRRPADKSSADPQDSDNDGLWTSMYGAGECFDYAATRNSLAKTRAKAAFEALRFLQKVTQGGPHAPPKGFIARTIRPSDWPDPNIGLLESDRREQQHDKFWKVYEPRWPKSEDGSFFWKSDTSSDELDGHYFFYPLYYDFCADSEPERERVREVVRDITDHLVAHDFTLVDHDGTPTRWGVYGPKNLNENPNWWAERGLKSLSILSYLAVAAHVTGDGKYQAAARELIEHHGYAHNAMYPKVQQGPGSGNQSDDEMAFMCFYGLLRCSHDEDLKSLVRYSFFQYWVNEAPELNPFFNFAYAAQNRSAAATNAWATVSLKPWEGWLDDAMSTLRGFPLDRLNWPHRNGHRLDVVGLPAVSSSDLGTPDRPRERGHLLNGKVLPVENRHFNHWNTDPWQLDYGGDGGELAAGTVFLLPYYMGLYHGFIEKPPR